MRNLHFQQQTLTEDEFDRLTDFLDVIGPSAMNIEMLDGYFSALICGPDLIMPSEYMPQVLGQDHVWDSLEQITDITHLLTKHWNTIASTLWNTLEEPNVYLPVLLEGDDGIAHGNDWALGFMRGVHTRASSWRELIDSDEHGGSMLPIMLLAHEHDPDPAMRPPPVTDEKRENLLQMMTASLTVIYRFFEPHRRSVTHTPLRRDRPKIGRNEPCPCGSGRKYKHCCAIDVPMLH